MTVFTEQDADKLVRAYRLNKELMKECEFDYFSSIASDYYLHLLIQNKDVLLEQLNQNASRVSLKKTIRTPIETVQTTNPYHKKPIIGRVFSSLSGLRTRCMYEIYRNSDFKSRMNYLISDSNKFFITLDFTLEDNGEEMRHTCTVWLNYRLVGQIPEDKEFEYQQQHNKYSDIIC